MTPGRARFRPVVLGDRVSVPLTAAAAGLVAVAFVSMPAIHALLVTHSDALLPVAWAQNLLREPATVGWFQLPRVPSLVPDLALTTLFVAAAPSWQHAAACYAVASYVLTVLAGGAVAGRMSGRPFGRAAATLLLVATLAQAAGMLLRSGFLPYVFTFLPAFHSGSFVVSLAGLLLAERLLARPSLPGLAVLSGTAALGVLSDRLFVGSFLIPLLFGFVAGPGLRAARPVIACALAGCIAGLVLDALLFPALLLRQPDPSIDLRRQLGAVPALLRDHGVHAGVLLGATALVLPAAWARDGGAPRLWWAAGAATVAGFLGLLPLLYDSPLSTRYMQAVWWWGLVAVAAAVLRAPHPAVPAGVCACVLAAILGTVGKGAGLFRPAQLVGYHSPVAECLAPLQAAGTVHAGLAHYWFARPTEVSGGPALQIAQVDAAGAAFPWGSNAYYYTHSKAGVGAEPLFDFVVIRGLDPAAIRTRFGEPATVVPCRDSDIWLYPVPGGLGRRIG